MKRGLLVVLVTAQALTASAATLYVWQNSPGFAPPYATWASAATNIQDAIDAATVGDDIVVTNGVYATGGRGLFQAELGFNYFETNRVAVTKPVRVRSVNGPAVTVIEGYQDPGGFLGTSSNAVRCVYLTNGAALTGFRLTLGGAASNGGGVWCESTNALLSNCVLAGNSANGEGGGAYRGTLNNCVLTNNIVGDEGGGAAYSVLSNCVLVNNSASDAGGAYLSVLGSCVVSSNYASSSGGGALNSTLTSCVVSKNFAGTGGGAYDSTLVNCVLSGNFADAGGGAERSVLYHCTVTGNSAGGAGGGTESCTSTNCIIYLNTAPGGDNYPPDPTYAGTFSYSCTTPLPGGVGNITNEPAFVNVAAGNYRLRPGSPCIDAGADLSAILARDLDGNPRPLDGNRDGIAAFDMGAYEFGPAWPASPGAVVAWGNNSEGQTNVPFAAQSGVMAIAAGGAHTVALKHNGSVLAWGYNADGQTTVPGVAQSGVTAIAAGGYHTVVLKSDGSVLAWGYNADGQTTVPVTAQSGVAAIAAGRRHTVDFKTNGSVLAWGDNVDVDTTVPVAAQSGVTAIAAGADHTVALKNDGGVVAWGDSYYGQTTVPVAAQSGVTAIAAGEGHTVALKNDGSVLAWGYNADGQTTVPVTAQSGVAAIAAGRRHTVAIVSVQLDAMRSGNNLVLSWPANATGFTLQSTLQLTAPATWVDVTNAPALLGAQWTVTNSFSGGAQFYRLRKQ